MSKFCKDCVYYTPEAEFSFWREVFNPYTSARAKCAAPQLGLNPVDGTPKISSPYAERFLTDRCGPKGAWWKSA